MMNDMITICKTTYIRVMRTRSLYVLLACVLILVSIAHLYNDLSLGRNKELMFDVAAALLTLAGVMTALIVTFDITRELREKVVMTLLSKPLGRGQYLLGKFLGVAWVGTINLAILTVGMFYILKWEHEGPRWDFLQLALAGWGMMILTTALGVFFASFLSELPAAVLTVLVYALGYITEPLYHFGQGWFFRILPNYWLLDFKTDLGNGLPVTWPLIVIAVLYSLAYSGVLLSLANIVFHKRDLA